MKTFTVEQQNIIHQATDYVKQKMQSAHASHGWDHVERVLHNAQRIALQEKDADLFIVTVATLLHDIERAEQDKHKGKICHAELGSASAYDFLLANRLGEKQAQHIADCILTHRYRNEHIPATIEAKILYDADKLDSIGAIGIGRAFLFAGEVGARLHDPNVDLHTTLAYSQDDTAYREFLDKLRFIKDKLLTIEGRRIAEDRHHFMELFFKRLTDEIHAEL